MQRTKKDCPQNAMVFQKNKGSIYWNRQDILNDITENVPRGIMAAVAAWAIEVHYGGVFLVVARTD